MQRRAAAAYIVLFMILAAGSVAVLAVSQPPQVTMDADEAAYTLGQGDQVTVDGRTYTVASVSPGSQASLAWTNESVPFGETWDDGSTVSNVTIGGETRNGTFVVLVENATDPTSATLREETTVPTRDIDGVTYAFEDVNNDSEAQPDELTPIEEYVERELAAGNLTQFTVAEGETDYRGNVTTVNVTSEAVELSWRAPETESVTARQASNVSLNDRQFFGFFTSQGSISLFENPEGFLAHQEEVASVDYFSERANGLWGIAILSIVAATFVVALGFLPRKDT